MKRYRNLLIAFLLLVYGAPAWALENLTDMDENTTPEENHVIYVVDPDLAFGSRRGKLQMKNVPKGFTTDTPTDEQCFTYEATGTTYEWQTCGGGSGSMTSIKENNVAVGGADIVTLDFLGADFDLAEDPDTEIQVIINSGITRTTEIDTAAKLEAVANLGAFFNEYADDATAAAMMTTMGLTANGQSLVTAADYAAMRTLLDLEAGTDFYSVSAADSAFEGELDNEAGLYAALSDVADFVQTSEINTAVKLETVANLGAFANEYLDDVDASTMRATLGLAIGTNVQAWDAELDTIAALTETNGGVIFAAGGVWTTDTTPAIDCTDCTNIPSATVEDDVYGSGWNADSTNAPSQNSVYDILHQYDTDDDGDIDNIDAGVGGGDMSSFFAEDGDGTEVEIDEAKEWKFIEGSGLDIDWTDTDTGSDADPFDLTIKVADDGIDSAHYAAASIDNEHLADNAADSDEIAAGAIDAAHMSANSVDSDSYVDGSIDEAHMSANSVDSDSYVDGSIDEAHMSANSVDSDSYVDASIDLAHMSVESIDSDQYVDASIDTAHIAGDAIDQSLIADDALQEEHLKAVDAAADEECLTYEETTGDFEWQACGSGSPGGSDTHVQYNNSSAFGGEATFVYDDTNNCISVGTGAACGTALAGSAHRIIAAGSTLASASISSFHNGADAYAGYIKSYKSRSGAIIQDGDSAGGWVGYAHDGVDYEPIAGMLFHIDGTPGSNDMPGKIVFSTTADGASTRTDALTVDNAQKTTAHGTLQTGLAGTDGSLVIWSDEASDQYATFGPPADMTMDTAYTLPPDDGDAGEQLQTDGSGALTWESAGSFDSTAVDATTWSDNANASNIWTFDVSGTDHTMTAGNGLMTFGDAVTVTDTLTASGGLAVTGVITSTVGIDAGGDYDFDIGSADVDDVTIITDGGTYIFDNGITGAGEDLGSTAAEWNDLFLNDGGVIQLGADQDVTITHVADTGILVNLEVEVDGTLDADGVVALGDGGDNFSVASDGIDIDTSGNIANAGTIGSGAITSTGAVEGTSITDGTATLNAGSMTAVVGIDASGTISANLFNPDAADGADIGGTSLEFSDLYLADGSIINLGADQDVTLTHVADTGVQIELDDKLLFGDTAVYIHSDDDGYLDIEADTGIRVLGPIDMGGNTVEIHNSTSDLALGTEGQIGLQSTDDQLAFHGGSAGEIQGEAAMSLLKHVSLSVDPGAWYDSDAEIFLFTVGDDGPEGITITEWKSSCNVDPDTEIDADLRYADAFIGLANAADIDEIDTTSGTSSEDTNASINGGSAVANGKVVYIGFDADPEGTCVQWNFEMWFYAEED